MSNTQYAFIEKARIPDRCSLQTSIDALGFDLTLDPTYTPFEDSGFSPCILNGKHGFGFEIYYNAASEITETNESLLEIANGNDYCIRMVWHSSMSDLACAMIVCCALAIDFNAVVSYEGEPPDSLEKMLASTHEIIKDADGEEPPLVKEPSPSSNSSRSKPWWKFW